MGGVPEAYDSSNDDHDDCNEFGSCEENLKNCGPFDGQTVHCENYENNNQSNQLRVQGNRFT